MPKPVIRHEMLVRRLAEPEGERFAAATDLMRKAQAFLSKRDYETIAGYYPIKAEIDVLPLLEVLHDHHKHCALPVIQEGSHLLHFRRWYPGMPLSLGKHGIAEPPESAAELVPQVLLVPLLAFDAQNHRLGYGGGYYDATIAHLRAQNPNLLTLGCAYKWQKLSKLPRIPSDIALDKVLAV